METFNSENLVCFLGAMPSVGTLAMKVENKGRKGQTSHFLQICQTVFHGFP